jgi:hypothetical protein
MLHPIEGLLGRTPVDDGFTHVSNALTHTQRNLSFEVKMSPCKLHLPLGKGLARHCRRCQIPACVGRFTMQAEASRSLLGGWSAGVIQT